MRALFIGRFQPFHKGHEDAIEQIITCEDELIIGLSSAQESRTEKNPFSADEREEMINLSLSELECKIENQPSSEIIKIVRLYDQRNCDEWIEHVRKSCEFNIIYSGEEHIIKKFENKGYLTGIVEKKYDISGTEIRMQIRTGQEWKCYVPEGTKQVIDRIVIDRIIDKKRDAEQYNEYVNYLNAVKSLSLC